MILNLNLLFIQSFNFKLLKENQDELELLCAFDVSLDKIRKCIAQCMCVRSFTKFGIKVLWMLQSLGYLTFEDLKLKILEVLDQNWSCPDSARLAVTV